MPRKPKAKPAISWPSKAPIQMLPAALVATAIVIGNTSRSAKAHTSLSTASACCRSSRLSKSRMTIDLCFGSGMVAGLGRVQYTRAGYLAPDCDGLSSRAWPRRLPHVAFLCDLCATRCILTARQLPYKVSPYFLGVLNAPSGHFELRVHVPLIIRSWLPQHYFGHRRCLMERRIDVCAGRIF